MKKKKSIVVVKFMERKGTENKYLPKRRREKAVRKKKK